MASLLKNVAALPQAIPAIFTQMQRGAAIAREIRARTASVRPEPQIYLADKTYRPSLCESDIWVDEGLPASGVVTRDEYLNYIQFQHDSHAVANLLFPFAFAGPLGLVAWPFLLSCDNALPSAFIRSEEQRKAAQLAAEMPRVRIAHLIRMGLRKQMDGRFFRTGFIPTRATYARFNELFDMDSDSVTPRLFDFFMASPIAATARFEYMSADTVKDLAEFCGVPHRWLSPIDRQRYVARHYAQLFTDDCFLRHNNAIASLSDAALFDAAYARGLARNEEVGLTPAELRRRMATWLDLTDSKRAGGGGHRVPLGLTVLLPLNVYCDPAADPHPEAAEYAAISANPDAKALQDSDLRAAYETALVARRGREVARDVEAARAASARAFERDVAFHQTLAAAAASLARVGAPAAVAEAKAESTAAKVTDEAKEEAWLPEDEKAFVPWLSKMDAAAEVQIAEEEKAKAHPPSTGDAFARMFNAAKARGRDFRADMISASKLATRN